FNKAKTISEGSYVLDLYYGSHNQRTKTVLKQGSQFYAILKTKYFVSNFYEKEVTLSGTSGTRHLNYIYGNDGLVAILAQTSASDAGTMYYIHTDHLGSYTLITDQNKNKVDSLWFDPWGNRRQYNSWATADTRTSFLFDRGFTGHEHLDRFKIINMNGRLYDPVIARFFSPDPFVQMPGFTQNYNRYSYALNNPLIYKDPSGESFIVAAAIIGAFINAAINVYAGNIHNFGDLMAYGAIGGAAGAAGAAVGAAVWGATAVGGFVGGFYSGAAGGAVGGFMTGAGNAWMGGASFGQGLFSGVQSSIVGGIMGGLMGGLFSGINAAVHGADFSTGTFSNDLTFGTSSESYEEALAKAARYNEAEYKTIDVELKNRMTNELNFKVGDLNVNTITSKVPDGLGLSGRDNFISKDGSIIYGRTTGVFGKSYTMNIPKGVVRSPGMVHFKAFAGHEIIHAYHYSVISDALWDGNYSEGIAYRFTYNVYLSAGANYSPYASKFYEILNTYPTNIPAAYNIPSGLPWPIY
ncbi:MAG: RHS repeat-associated core domain-containing protein, partial [Bacteroidales bacterium]|nr:RHS repeat-associated core domain-containing protein [Bacteroidales bacterium]